MKNTSVLPVFDIHEIDKLYSNNEFGRLSDKFIEVFDFFCVNTAYGLTVEEFNYIDQFIHVFLHVFCDSRFVISKDKQYTYIGFNNVISNLVSITQLKNTDNYLKQLINQENSLYKLLTLYSARNEKKLDESEFFEIDSDLSSYWYCVFSYSFYSGLVNERVAQSLKRHYLFSHKKLNYVHDLQVLYFGSTYLGGEIDRIVKKNINNYIQSKIVRPASNSPKGNKIGVFSLNWRKNHSVYRNYWAYLFELSKKYELTFFKLDEDSYCDTELFHKVLTFKNFQQLLESKELMNNNFAAFYFPDVGMNQESIILSNYRIAPIQICSPGHSVSTFGSKIDYFISGKDVEVKNNPQNNYSERLVLIPGMGVIHNRPEYIKKSRQIQSDEVIINCSWHAQKINFEFVAALRGVIDRLKTRIKLRIFLADSTSKQNDHISFVSSLLAELDSGVIEIYAGLLYEEYMEKMEEGSFSIDSFHFGGCNTVSDSLYLGLPVITWEGNKWYNRIGSEMLRLCRLDDLIATSSSEFVELLVRFIEDHEYRAVLHKKLKDVNLDQTIYSNKHAQSFVMAVDHLIENHAVILKKLESDPITII